MAWYALYRWFKRFSTREYTNWIQWYKKKLYDDWFNSLTKEQQEQVLEVKRLKQEESDRKFKDALATLGWMCGYLNERTHGGLDYYMRALTRGIL